jgi:CelD/BcsL family acetyltransferase involved in cellulose biosynthesis
LHSASAPEPSWSPNETTWILRLGEIPVRRSRFRLLQLDGHFADWIQRPIPAAPAAARGGDVAGAVIRSLPLAAPMPALAIENGLIHYTTAMAPRHWISLEGSFAEYLAKFSSKTRQTLGRKTRKLMAPPVSAVFRTYRSPEEMQEFIREARALSAKTYQERLLGVGFPSEAAFHERIVERAASGLEQGFLLFSGDKAIAYLYTPEVKPGVFSYHSLGYDPEYEQHSPGTVLQYLALEHLFAQGKQGMFDFGEGETEQKRLFGTHSVLCADVYLLRVTPGNLGRVGLRVLLESTSSAVVWVLERAGIKRWVKRAMRRGAAGKAAE